ncbi:MAG: hypothetical protein AB1696_07475 [Planctomycetota bacterium]
MKRVMTIVGLSVALLLSASMIAEAQSKKKGKEPELAICKRGNLIFEDDFSGKEVEWNVTGGEWKIEKNSLVTRSKGTVANKDYPSICRPFAEVPNVVFEFRVLLPMKGSFGVYGKEGGSNAQNPGASFSPNTRTVSITYWAPHVDLAKGPLVYAKPRWLDVIFELYTNKYALTVDGKTMRGEVPPGEGIQRNTFLLTVPNPNGELFAIDDVKVYEALPKDEGEGEDEKGKKRK